jgi:hypothetical protein
MSKQNETLKPTESDIEIVREGIRLFGNAAYIEGIVEQSKIDSVVAAFERIICRIPDLSREELSEREVDRLIRNRVEIAP